jgi:hypothetical protein
MIVTLELGLLLAVMTQAGALAWWAARVTAMLDEMRRAAGDHEHRLRNLERTPRDLATPSTL